MSPEVGPHNVGDFINAAQRFRLEYQWVDHGYYRNSEGRFIHQSTLYVLGHKFTGTANKKGRAREEAAGHFFSTFPQYRSRSFSDQNANEPTGQSHGLIGGASASDALGTGSRSPSMTAPCLNQESDPGASEAAPRRMPGEDSRHHSPVLSHDEMGLVTTRGIPPLPPVNHPRGSHVTPVCEVVQGAEELAAFSCNNLTQQISSMRQVDQGGYSLVYKGIWVPDSPEATQEVAVKVLFLSYTRDWNPELKCWKRLQRELRVWSRLHHTNVVSLLGYFDAGCGWRGFVCPWYPERNVIMFLKKYPSANRDIICADVASGLEYLHSRSPPIVHGDMKGENILMTLDGRASICDFGLSIILDGNPTGFTSSVVGMTLLYSAPELLERNDKTVEADVYAYGCTCIEILLTKRPYENIRDPVALIKAIESGAPPIAPEQLRECNSILPLHYLVQCWSMEPSDRPQAGKLAEAFRGVLGIHEVPESSPYKNVIRDGAKCSDTDLSANESLPP
ncbi:kinase-like domain-containing protein [Cantharellus anzutake]|uniref:kinase-like domain-containing protein n=1 Tax=Cantharellus anzutake TaxID=1750568 RepID=UPI001908C62D|nr:kinase-like domain-containing protein [Cantharellus anzutake]KAF8316456.1 kinase-like domain-containing protein [Cantharellus anzutake]